jgi:hypothetical protein
MPSNHAPAASGSPSVSSRDSPTSSASCTTSSTLGPRPSIDTATPCIDARHRSSSSSAHRASPARQQLTSSASDSTTTAIVAPATALRPTGHTATCSRCPVAAGSSQRAIRVVPERDSVDQGCTPRRRATDPHAHSGPTRSRTTLGRRPRARLVRHRACRDRRTASLRTTWLPHATGRADIGSANRRRLGDYERALPRRLPCACDPAGTRCVTSDRLIRMPSARLSALHARAAKRPL